MGVRCWFNLSISKVEIQHGKLQSIVVKQLNVVEDEAPSSTAPISLPSSSMGSLFPPRPDPAASPSASLPSPTLSHAGTDHHTAHHGSSVYSRRHLNPGLNSPGPGGLLTPSSPALSARAFSDDHKYGDLLHHGDPTSGMPGSPMPAAPPVVLQAPYEGLTPLSKTEHRLECAVLLSCAQPELDGKLLSAVGHSPLVLDDGRMVVDTMFRTVDPLVYAAGPIAKFARKYGPYYPLQHFSSKEVGEKLAACLREVLNASLTLDEVHAPETPPPFMQPKVFFSHLPGDMCFFHASLPQPSHPEMQQTLMTDQEDLTAMVFDEYCQLRTFIYLGRRGVSPQKLSYLLGTPISYFHELIDLYEDGQINDLMSYLDVSWSSPLFHDAFAPTRHAITYSVSEEKDIRTLIDQILSRADNDPQFDGQQLAQLVFDKVDTMDESTRQRIIMKLVKFLYVNSNHLPGFSFPDHMMSKDL
eukprot:TRINITY_DN9555_c0_g1_i7.p1 TRINITY_DN9555_c0_g1~~TRINITY_DN9555_c0_g1_i7.p1  ORF type:complete len:470 (-),score=44.15 TRINITY_DN9555_c0_g1_i7:32-1441(-)